VKNPGSTGTTGQCDHAEKVRTLVVDDHTVRVLDGQTVIAAAGWWHDRSALSPKEVCSN